MHDAIEVRRQFANKACWKDILIYKSKDTHGRSSVDDWWTTYLPSSFSGVTLGPGQQRPSKGSRSRRPKQCSVCAASQDEKEETLVDYHARTCKTPRKMWVQMCLPFLYEVIAESMWRAMGWVCFERPNAA